MPKIEFPRELRGKKRIRPFMRLDNCCLEINSIQMNLPEWAINQPSRPKGRTAVVNFRNDFGKLSPQEWDEVVEKEFP